MIIHLLVTGMKLINLKGITRKRIYDFCKLYDPHNWTNNTQFILKQKFFRNKILPKISYKK